VTQASLSHANENQPHFLHISFGKPLDRHVSSSIEHDRYIPARAPKRFVRIEVAGNVVVVAIDCISIVQKLPSMPALVIDQNIDIEHT
jgi:hypothetical protein